MDRVLDRIAERRALLVEQAGRLRKELAEVEAELERVSSAEQVVTQLLAETGGQEDEPIGEQDGDDGGDVRLAAPLQVSGQVTGPAARPALAVPHRGDDVGLADLPAEYQRLMQIVAAEGPVACKRVTVKLGLTAEPRHIEGVRVKLKRLVARGWLAEVEPGRFAPHS